MSPYGRRSWPAHCRFSRLLPTAVTLCVLFAPLGCRTVPRETANPTCTGDERVAVRNETGELLDVYMLRPGQHHAPRHRRARPNGLYPTSRHRRPEGFPRPEIKWPVGLGSVWWQGKTTWL